MDEKEFKNVNLLTRLEDIKTVLGHLKEKRENIFSRKLLQVAFLFDTTGSMYPYFEQAKESILRIIKKVTEKKVDVLFSYIPYKNHGDEEYFDGIHPFYATDFVKEPKKIQVELDKIANGGGGDGLTALEDVLHYLNNQAIWQPRARKVVVLIGDMPPHGVLDAIKNCLYGYNYESEVKKLAEKGVKVYSIFCCEEKNFLSSRKQKVQSFFKWIAEITNGCYLSLAEIDDLVDLLIGICMKETGHLDEFINDLKTEKILSSSKQRLLLSLGGKK